MEQTTLGQWARAAQIAAPFDVGFDREPCEDGSYGLCEPLPLGEAEALARGLRLAEIVAEVVRDKNDRDLAMVYITVES